LPPIMIHQPKHRDEYTKHLITPPSNQADTVPKAPIALISD